LSLYVHAQNNRPDIQYQITDKIAMGKWVAHHIIEFTRDVGKEELGESDFYTLLDELISAAYEYGETWLTSNLEDEWTDNSWRKS
jgi:hypothetical protein